MSKNAKAPATSSTEEAVKTALKASPGATAEGVASAAGIGRSTAGKMLSRLTQAGEVSRAEGGREGARRLPDRYTLHDAPAPALTGSGAKATGSKGGSDSGAHAKTTANGKGAPSNVAAPEAATSPDSVERLRPGQLDELVLKYLKENAAAGPHGPTGVARALERSSGAVGNCLVRLADAKEVRQVSEKPRRYSLAA